MLSWPVRPLYDVLFRGGLHNIPVFGPLRESLMKRLRGAPQIKDITCRLSKDIIWAPITPSLDKKKGHLPNPVSPFSLAHGNNSFLNAYSNIKLRVLSASVKGSKSKILNICIKPKHFTACVKPFPTSISSYKYH